MFARGEMVRLCKEALASGPKTTKELALHVMASKGLDTGDKVLAHAMAQRMIHALRQQWRRGQFKTAGRWRVPGCGGWCKDFNANGLTLILKRGQNAPARQCPITSGDGITYKSNFFGVHAMTLYANVWPCFFPLLAWRRPIQLIP